jgi:hypothetical protein
MTRRLRLTTPFFFRYLVGKIRNCATLRSCRLCPIRAKSSVTERLMVGTRIVCAGCVAAIVLALALGGAQALTATSEQAGKPVALLAGLRPPHEHHAKTAHAARNKTADKKSRHATVAAAHARHSSTRKTAKSEHREHAVAASAFAEEPPAQAAPDVTPARDWSAANSAPAANSVAAVASDTTLAPLPESMPPGAEAGSNPTAVKIQTVKITAPDQAAARGPTADHVASAAATPSDDSTDAPRQQTALAAPMHRDESAVGSASWIAQVLAALGGAVAAGAVAWFLIGGGPVRTYG